MKFSAPLAHSSLRRATFIHLIASSWHYIHELPPNSIEMIRMETTTATFKLLKFSDLPSDLLDPITCRLHYLDIANLWFIGCTALNVKLAKGGVSQLRVTNLPGSKPFHWPSMWSQLEHLRRIGFYNWSKEVITVETLRSLPMRLKEMRIDFASSFSALQQLLRHDVDSFPTLESLEMHVRDTDHHMEDVVPLWPRFLLRLSFTSYVYRLPLYLSSLPPSLTYLKGEFKEIRNTPPTTFPQSITAIWLHLKSLDSNLMSLLPIGLKTLNFDAHDPGKSWRERGGPTEEWAIRSLKLLPRGLTYLNWPVNTFKRENLQLLPSSLETLHVASILPEDWPFLPKSITDCSGCVFEENAAGKDIVHQRPAGLQHFSVTARALAHVKSNLKVGGVSVRVCGPICDLKEEMDALNIERLDSSIKSLTCEVLSEQYLLQVLPICLTHLRLESADIESGALLSLLPQTLRGLEWHVQLEEEKWKLLPRKLEKLIFSTPPRILYVESASWLPRHLLTLNFGRFATSVPLAWFEGLPRGLKEISIQIPLDLFPVGPTASSPSTSLPPSLTNICLQTQTIPEDIEERLCKLIASLPPGTEDLNIFAFNYPKINVPQHLFPKRLTSLSVPMELQITRENP